MKKNAFLLTIFFTAFCANAQESSEHTRLKENAKQHLINLINIDTSQPDGNEIAAARYIYKVFNEYGIDWEVYQPEKNRASISAIIKGTDKKEKPLILLSHLDTVAPTSAWTHPPFKATVENGRIYGLGSTDDKNFVAVYLTIITWMKENNIQPKRDIIFLSTADEEAGSNKGIKWLVSSKTFTLPSGAFAINEGGTIIKEKDKAPIVFVEAATKMYMDLKVTAYGHGGHSATADKENNAVYNLSQALSKIEKLQMPHKLTPFTRKFFADIHGMQDEDAKTTIDILLGYNKHESEMAAEIVAEDPFFKTQIQDTLIPTVLSSGSETNTSSSEASAVLNCRLLPSTDPDEFIAALKSVFETDDNIFIEVLERPKTPFPQPSTGEDALFKSIKKSVETLRPEAITLMGMTPASSDSEILRRSGVTTYGLGTVTEAAEDIAQSGRAHAANENIKEEDFYSQLDLFLNVVYNFAVADDNLHLYFPVPTEAQQENPETAEVPQQEQTTLEEEA
ncbi:acetylornithine deacetylase/succinyl-diaminopimelate desuccinylase-like protein [Elusimicrobium posterum]|uniref:M20/M25/M40 family metallo-hydrolase n=1 Tax=Elusimicrobium posterum TaxID=3116653 RepID=UPI003C784C2E